MATFAVRYHCSIWIISHTFGVCVLILRSLSHPAMDTNKPVSDERINMSGGWDVTAAQLERIVYWKREGGRNFKPNVLPHDGGYNT